MNDAPVENEPIRILLVEDTPGDVLLMEHYLRQVRNLNFHLSHVGQLEAMNKLLQTESFDVLVLDMNLPDSRGLNTISRAMKQAPWIPIVVLTSVDNEASGMEAVRRGAQDYLIKGEVDGWLIVRTIRYAIERKRTQRELQYSLALAGEVQRAVLPSRSPPEWTHFRATARSRPSGSVGGDFYDFVHINEGQIAVFMGNVTGHEVRSVLLMTRILGFLRSEQGNRTTQVVSDLNRTLLALGDSIGTALTCSLFCTILDAPSGTIFHLNAGQPPPYLYEPQAGKLHSLGARGNRLGVQRFEAVEMCHALGPGARMVLYTDGILDACNTAGERFGRTRLEEAIRKHGAQEVEGFADMILHEVNEFRQGVPQVDDESLVVVDRI